MHGLLEFIFGAVVRDAQDKQRPLGVDAHPATPVQLHLQCCGRGPMGREYDVMGGALSIADSPHCISVSHQLGVSGLLLFVLFLSF